MQGTALLPGVLPKRVVHAPCDAQLTEQAVAEPGLTARDAEQRRRAGGAAQATAVQAAQSAQLASRLDSAEPTVQTGRARDAVQGGMQALAGLFGAAGDVATRLRRGFEPHPAGFPPGAPTERLHYLVSPRRVRLQHCTLCCNCVCWTDLAAIFPSQVRAASSCSSCCATRWPSWRRRPRATAARPRWCWAASAWCSCRTRALPRRRSSTRPPTLSRRGGPLHRVPSPSAQRAARLPECQPGRPPRCAGAAARSAVILPVSSPSMSACAVALGYHARARALAGSHARPTALSRTGEPAPVQPAGPAECWRRARRRAPPSSPAAAWRARGCWSATGPPGGASASSLTRPSGARPSTATPRCFPGPAALHQCEMHAVSGALCPASGARALRASLRLHDQVAQTVASRMPARPSACINAPSKFQAGVGGDARPRRRMPASQSCCRGMH